MTPTLEGWPTKAKEAPSPHEVRLAPLDTNPVFQSLQGQPLSTCSKSFRNSTNDLGGITWFGVPNATDIWQPVDGGYAATLKTLINLEFFNWLDDEYNVEK